MSKRTGRKRTRGSVRRTRRRTPQRQASIDRGARKIAALVGHPLPMHAKVHTGKRRRPAWGRLLTVAAAASVAAVFTLNKTGVL